MCEFVTRERVRKRQLANLGLVQSEVKVLLVLCSKKSDAFVFSLQLFTLWISFSKVMPHCLAVNWLVCSEVITRSYCRYSLQFVISVSHVIVYWCAVWTCQSRVLGRVVPTCVPVVIGCRSHVAAGRHVHSSCSLHWVHSHCHMARLTSGSLTITCSRLWFANGLNYKGAESTGV